MDGAAVCALFSAADRRFPQDFSNDPGPGVPSLFDIDVNPAKQPVRACPTLTHTWGSGFHVGPCSSARCRCYAACTRSTPSLDIRTPSHKTMGPNPTTSTSASPHVLLRSTRLVVARGLHAQWTSDNRAQNEETPSRTKTSIHRGTGTAHPGYGFSPSQNLAHTLTMPGVTLLLPRAATRGGHLCYDRQGHLPRRFQMLGSVS